MSDETVKPVEMYRVVARRPAGAFGGPGGAVVKRWTYSSTKAFEAQRARRKFYSSHYTITCEKLDCATGTWAHFEDHDA
jgi:hypothetical protein